MLTRSILVKMDFLWRLTERSWMRGKGYPSGLVAALTVRKLHMHNMSQGKKASELCRWDSTRQTEKSVQCHYVEGVEMHPSQPLACPGEEILVEKM